LFDEGGKRPISDRIKNSEEEEVPLSFGEDPEASGLGSGAKFSFSRKPQQRGILPGSVLSLLIGALFLAAIAYFCLIIFGKL